jgi:hypothetical protein
MLSSVGWDSIYGSCVLQLRYADTAEGFGLQFVVMSPDVSRSDRPKCSGKYVLSWISKMRSYCDEVVKTDITSEKDVDSGATVTEYDVPAALVFDYKRSAQKAVSNAEYNKISNKVYNRLNCSFGEEITLLASVGEGDGRGSIEKIVGTLGFRKWTLSLGNLSPYCGREGELESRNGSLGSTKPGRLGAWGIGRLGAWGVGHLEAWQSLLEIRSRGCFFQI